MIEIKRLTHSSVLIRSGDMKIYIDPYMPDTPTEKVKKIYRDLEKGDVILITHPHHDHCDPETFEDMLKEESKIIASVACEDKIEHDFIGLEIGDDLTIDGIEIKSTHAYNVKRKRDSGEPFHPKGEGMGYLITIDDYTIYHPGDTEKIPEMEELKGIDLAFLPIDGTYTMNIDEAVRAAKTIESNIVIPFHEREADPEEFKKRLGSEDEIIVKLLQEGESLQI